ncbi:hypothetical protein DMB65_14980 [Flavobacterium cheongpyeongense]|uniref:RDD domain-containing protein n=1 Tax=Flavobacterium cheongpyeongense TaxID=2212651 RepID=A0A2V4BMA7_9FLAO|nr:RDD family protein [Flavobacterium cheongpyeongense]PXY40089.1 hypothetical protein DMB65_14980 [Flavobacterium cheongpyeongense]
MRKRNYLSKRIGAALIDLLLFALIFKAVEPFLFYDHSRDPRNTDNNGYFFLVFYLVYLSQDIFMNKTIGKHIFKLEMTFDNVQEPNGYKKYFRIIIRRIFDLFELVCPFIFLLSIILTKNNQKLGDIISKIIIKPKTIE